MTTVCEHYLICALWSSIGDDGEPLDDCLDISDFAREAIERAELHCAYFLDRAGPWISDEDQTEEQIGHDLWLTRNGHGTGFLDRDLPNSRGEILSKICKTMGECDAYVGDDGRIYLS